MSRFKYKILLDEEISKLNEQDAQRIDNFLIKLVNELKIIISGYEDSIKRTEDRANYPILFTFVFSLFALIQYKLSTNLPFYFISIFPSLVVAILFSILVFIRSPSVVQKSFLIEENRDIKVRIAKNQGLYKFLKFYGDRLYTLWKWKIKFLKWSSSFMFSHFIFSVFGIYCYLLELKFIEYLPTQLLILSFSFLLALIFEKALYKSESITFTISKNI
jgi:hypothetical protein